MLLRIALATRGLRLSVRADVEQGPHLNVGHGSDDALTVEAGWDQAIRLTEENRRWHLDLVEERDPLGGC
jgi:hypothetical protein